MSKEYKEGRDAFLSGRSIHYNPYRDRGTEQQFTDWIAGYVDTQRGG